MQSHPPQLHQMILEGDHVLLRAVKVEDAEELSNLANNVKIWLNVRDMFPHPYLPEHAHQFIKSRLEPSDDHVFAIERQGQFCGMIGLHTKKDVYRKNLELGYWLGEPFWGKGIATMAVSLVCNFAFDKAKYNRIYAGVFEYNQASMRVLEKNGFSKEGIRKKAIFKNEAYWDEHLYGKVNPGS